MNRKISNIIEAFLLQEWNIKIDIIETVTWNDVKQLDSLSFVKLIVSIENELGIEFDEDMMIKDRFKNFGELISYIEEKVEG